MCLLCCLRADDVLVCIWICLPLQLKVCQLSRLSRCIRVRHSLLLPAVYVFDDDVHIRSSSVCTADLQESVSLGLVRLPRYLSRIRSLTITFTSWPHEPTSFPVLSNHSAPIDHHMTPSSSSTLPTNDIDNTATESRVKRQRTADGMVGLASLAHLRTLVLLQLHCLHCSSSIPAAAGDFRPEGSPAFPFLPRLEVLVMSGFINNHCFSLLLSIPTQCPQLSFIDLEDLSINRHQLEPVVAVGGGIDTALSEPQLLPFVRWLAGVNHCQENLPSGHIALCSLALVERPVESTSQEIQYVHLCHLNQESFDDWRMCLLLSPFRFLSPSFSSAWQGVRVLDLSSLEGALQNDLELVSALPPLPSLQYTLLPGFDPCSELDEPCDVDGVFRWLSSCPQLSMIDCLTFHPQWRDEPQLLVESTLAARLVSLEVVDTSHLAEAIMQEAACWDACFPLSAPSPFISLTHLALPVRVRESGQLVFQLTRLRHLPVLHSLLICLCVTTDDVAAGEKYQLDEEEEKNDSATSVLSQLAAIRSLRWLAVTDHYEAESFWESRSRSKEWRGVIAALFGPNPSSARRLQTLESRTSCSSTLQVVSLAVHLKLSTAEQVEAAIEGIACHIDHTTCQDLTIALYPRNTSHTHATVCIAPGLLRHLRPSVPQWSSGHPFCVTVAPLSPACLAAIDMFSEMEQGETAVQPRVEWYSNMMSRLSAVRHGSPRWTDAARVCGLRTKHYSLQKLSCRRITARCLWSITEPLLP